MIDTDVDCLIETLMQLIDIDYRSPISRNPLVLKERDQIELLYKELTSLRTFLSYSEETRHRDPKVRDLVIRITDVASKVEDVVDSFVSSLVANNAQGSSQDPFLHLDNFMQDIQSIKRDIESTNRNEPKVLKNKGSSSRVNIAIPKEDKIVGFDVEIREIMDRLVSDQKKLDIISIVGMGGLGKTALAKRVYNDPYATYHFYTRGWVTVSQTYETRDLLSGLCKSLSIMHDKEQSIARLRELIYKGLKGKRYLIVIDDIWSEEAWNDIRICFPDDNLRSRILVTSRLMNVALHIKPDSPVHRLRFLTVDESWDLFQHKVFAEDGSCPISLHGIGKQIAERCRGLPLAVLVISGLLAKTEKSVEFWTQVLDSIGSYIVSDPEQYMNTLSLSYNHLPHHMKSCFLYFGAFKEDFEIEVRELLWLWVAEGFVRPVTENVAEEYLIDLIDRSLVIVDQKRSDGGVKTCRVHDLLHDLCLKISKEENFMSEIKNEPFIEPGLSTNISVRRLFFHNDMFEKYASSKLFSPRTRSFLFFESGVFVKEIVSFNYSAFKHIRVLKLKSIILPIFPTEIGQLVQLRYLSLGIQGLVIPESVSTLWNLQTLLVYGVYPIDFQFCKDSSMTNLMHVCIWPSVRIYDPVALPKVKTISMLHLPFERNFVSDIFPNVKKLGCVVLQQPDGSALLPPLDTLVHLEKLKLKIEIDNNYSDGNLPMETIITCLNRLPHNLKKVTFYNCILPWKDFSELGRLPNLVILKILRGKFQGRRWDTNDGEFKKLKFLKIQSRELVEWNTCSDHFPVLEKLVMDDCRWLKEIPMCLGDIPTMGLIELRWPRSLAAESARRIIKEQQCLGNDWLKLAIYERRKFFTRGYKRHSYSDLFYGCDSSSDSSGDDKPESADDEESESADDST